MRFVSYAQNFEDVMLMRALSDVQGGFYIDVGAQGPEEYSVTKAFYERGWSGINIEPVESYWNMLVAERPRDINLRCLVGRESGTREFFEVDGTGLSTSSRLIADQYAHNTIRRRVVDQFTLDEICARERVGTVHFLKIDVEGAEAEVISGFSFAQVRPWILVVEATYPNSADPSYHEWEPTVLGHDYIFVWDDGLNRYYVAKERQQLAIHFKKPPNHFDDFVQAPLLAAKREIDRLNHHIENMNVQAGALNAQVEHLNAHIAHLESSLNRTQAELARVYGSLSWRVTGPLRFARRTAGTLRIRAAQALRAGRTHTQETETRELPESAYWIYHELKRQPRASTWRWKRRPR